MFPHLVPELCLLKGEESGRRGGEGGSWPEVSEGPPSLVGCPGGAFGEQHEDRLEGTVSRQVALLGWPVLAPVRQQLSFLGAISQSLVEVHCYFHHLSPQ